MLTFESEKTSSLVILRVTFLAQRSQLRTRSHYLYREAECEGLFDDETLWGGEDDPDACPLLFEASSTFRSTPPASLFVVELPG